MTAASVPEHSVSSAQTGRCTEHGDMVREPWKQTFVGKVIFESILEKLVEFHQVEKQGKDIPGQGPA